MHLWRLHPKEASSHDAGNKLPLPPPPLPRGFYVLRMLYTLAGFTRHVNPRCATVLRGLRFLPAACRLRPAYKHCCPVSLCTSRLVETPQKRYATQPEINTCQCTCTFPYSPLLAFHNSGWVGFWATILFKPFFFKPPAHFPLKRIFKNVFGVFFF
jgi:hypothetical protein